MCYIARDVYTVCAHTRVGGLVECEPQIARNERWGDGSSCLALLSCRPVEKTELKYWFCPECREHYGGWDTKTVDAVLNYWAFKNARGYSSSISPKRVPAELVFGGKAPLREDDPKRPRLELIALGKELPREPFEDPLAWLQRLEEARTMTIQVAEKWPSVEDREGLDEHVVRMQPRISTPMSVYPYSHALSSITELSEARQSPANPVRAQNPGACRQVHLKTLRKLCGEPSMETLALPPGEADQKQQEVDLWTRVSLPFGDEGAPSSHPPIPSCSPPAWPFSWGSTLSSNGQQRNSPGNLADAIPPREEPINEAGGAAVNGTGGETDPPSGPTDRDQERDSAISLPTGPSQGVPAEKDGPAQPPQANDGDLTDVPLDEASSKQQKDESDEPNKTSHFSVSDIDRNDAAELARALDIDRKVTIFVALDETDTDPRVSVPGGSEEEPKPAAVDSTVPGIVAPEPLRTATPPRFVHEDGASGDGVIMSEAGES
jgi:hypothetical protein